MVGTNVTRATTKELTIGPVKPRQPAPMSSAKINAPSHKMKGCALPIASPKDVSDEPEDDTEDEDDSEDDSDDVEDEDDTNESDGDQHVSTKKPPAQQKASNWDNGEPLSNEQCKVILALKSDYEQAKAINTIRNQRLLGELDVKAELTKVFEGTEGTKAGTASSKSRSRSAVPGSSAKSPSQKFQVTRRWVPIVSLYQMQT